VTLGEELEHVERYLRLEQARFRGLQVTVDVEPEALDAVVPAMSVQPLVENAVRHGVEQRAGTGLVEIVGRRLNGEVELRVRDDGAGIEPARVPAVLSGAGGGIGLSNVDARLRASFGERYALRIESSLGQGTTVVMTVPNFAAALGSTAAAGSTA
jgi:two-component system LytT family sensor kinase